MLELQYLESVKCHIWHEYTRVYEYVVAKAEECIIDPSKIHESGEQFSGTHEGYVKNYKLYKDILKELREIDDYIAERIKECEEDRNKVLEAFKLLGILNDDD